MCYSTERLGRLLGAARESRVDVNMDPISDVFLTERPDILIFWDPRFFFCFADDLFLITSAASPTDDHGPKEICQDHLYKGCQQSKLRFLKDPLVLLGVWPTSGLAQAGTSLSEGTMGEMPGWEDRPALTGSQQST